MKSFLAICTLFTLLNACGYSNTELNKFETQIKAYNRKYKLDLNPT